MTARQIVVAMAAALSAGAFAADDRGQQQPQAPSGRGALPSQSSEKIQWPPGEVVRQVQQRLNYRGIDVDTVDGRWTAKTEEGVRQFQSQQGLQATGQLDPQTLSALGLQQWSSATGASRPPQGGSSGKAPPADPSGPYNGSYSEGGGKQFE